MVNLACMQNFALAFLLFNSFFSYSQDFSKQEIQRVEKVLKRSNSVIREFNTISLVNGKSIISVEQVGNTEIEGLIETALFRSGFELVSNQVALDAAKISTSNKIEIDTLNTPSFNAVYLVKISVQYFKGGLFEKCQRPLSSFSARIVDLADNGKLVGTFQFAENTLTYAACGEDIANAFSYKLLETVK